MLVRETTNLPHKNEIEKKLESFAKNCTGCVIKYYTLEFQIRHICEEKFTILTWRNVCQGNNTGLAYTCQALSSLKCATNVCHWNGKCIELDNKQCLNHTPTSKLD